MKFVKARRSEESNPGELVVNDEYRFIKMGHNSDRTVLIMAVSPGGRG